MRGITFRVRLVPAQILDQIGRLIFHRLGRLIAFFIRRLFRWVSRIVFLRRIRLNRFVPGVGLGVGIALRPIRIFLNRLNRGLCRVVVLWRVRLIRFTQRLALRVRLIIGRIIRRLVGFGLRRFVWPRGRIPFDVGLFHDRVFRRLFRLVLCWRVRLYGLIQRVALRIRLVLDRLVHRIGGLVLFGFGWRIRVGQGIAIRIAFGLFFRRIGGFILRRIVRLFLNGVRRRVRRLFPFRISGRVRIGGRVTVRVSFFLNRLCRRVGGRVILRRLRLFGIRRRRAARCVLFRIWPRLDRRIIHRLRRRNEIVEGDVEIIEPQCLNRRQHPVHAVADHLQRVFDKGYDEIAEHAVKDGDVGAVAADQLIIAAAARQHIVAGAALKAVGGLIAHQRVVPRARRRVFDQRAIVAGPLQRIEHMALRKFAKAEEAALGGSADIQIRVAARRQIDGQVGFIGREIIAVLAIPVPDRAQDAIRAGRLLPGAVNHHLPGVGVERIDRVAAVGLVIRAVKDLDRGDVQHHQRLRPAIELVRVERARTALIRPVGHQGIFVAVEFRRQGARAVRIVAMFQTDGMADLMQESRPGVGADLGVVEVDRVEPGVAAPRPAGGKIGVGGAGLGRFGESQIGVAVRLAGQFGEFQQRDVGKIRQRRARGGHLGGVEGAEARFFIIPVVRNVIGAVGKAEGQRRRRPGQAAQERVDRLIRIIGDRVDGVPAGGSRLRGDQRVVHGFAPRGGAGRAGAAGEDPILDLDAFAFIHLAQHTRSTW